ncbi:P4HA3 [Branchiostoma lanceolatum]|uniref:procollagen-proline 4-dioxygenase n=1 Tax=Branchiostoma lanceolatum TaxID=7740 RepID=A0A8K0A4K1_BRALA|nr:P4HA3 [Branchiostoma lanceolatum]
MSIRFSVSSVVLAASMVAFAGGDFFSATVHMEGLVWVESEMARAVRNHVRLGGLVPPELHRLAEGAAWLSDPTRVNPNSLVHNPIGAYLLIKRLNQEWANAIKTLPQPQEVFGEMYEELQLPSLADLEGCALALMRLQDVYNLDMRRVIDGEIVMKCRPNDTDACHDVNVSELKNRTVPLRLSILDVFYFGIVAQSHNDFYHAALWLNETLAIMNANECELCPDRREVLDRLADTYSKLRNHRGALQLFSESYRIDPTNPHTQARIRDEEYYANLQGNYVWQLQRSDDWEGRDKYEELCRVGVLQNRAPRASVSCRYFRPSPYFYLQPIKMEVLHETNPVIHLFHDIVSESEAARMREMAVPKFHRSVVVGDDGGDAIILNRVSETAWHFDYDDPVVARLSRRVDYATGLSTAEGTAEAFQVVNYGLGGQYIPHTDYFEGDHVTRHVQNGNRVVTFLLYLSDVDAGGATVFPIVDVAVPVVRNSAAVFWSMEKSGAVVPNSLHAGCPVLIGSKWIANKWIREHGNEFRRPCGLTPDE